MRTTPARCRHQPWLAETSLGSPLLFVLSADLIGYERPGQQWIAPVPEVSNGELITVIEWAVDKNCFRQVLVREKDFRLAGGRHADISPSGRLVVVATLSTLAVYKLPETCSGTIR